MSVTNFKLDFMDTLKNDVKMLRHALSSSLAHKISDEMAENESKIKEFFRRPTASFYHAK